MDKFEVLHVIGEGAYGVVMKCQNKETGEVVAVKKFKQSEDDEKARTTALREVKLLRQLSAAENIVTLKEAFRRKGKLYLVLEFAEKNLLEILEANPHGVSSWQVRVYSYQLLKALAWCHQHDVIHRDIKPENLLVNADHSLRLCDFGFARTMERGARYTDYVATRWYRAPELLLGSHAYGARVDTWAAGCIMGEIVDAQPVFAGESEIDQLYVIQKCLGPLTAQQSELFYANPRFNGIKFPDMSRPTGALDLRYGQWLGRVGVDCLKSLLRIDPARRADADALLRHPYFESVHEASHREAVASRAPPPPPSLPTAAPQRRPRRRRRRPPRWRRGCPPPPPRRGRRRSRWRGRRTRTRRRRRRPCPSRARRRRSRRCRRRSRRCRRRSRGCSRSRWPTHPYRRARRRRSQRAKRPGRGRPASAPSATYGGGRVAPRRPNCEASRTISSAGCCARASPPAAAPRRSRARAARGRRRRRTCWPSIAPPPVAGGGRMTTTARLTAGFSAHAQPGFSGHGGGTAARMAVDGALRRAARARRPPAAVEAGRAMSAQNAIAARAGRDAAFATVYRF